MSVPSGPDGRGLPHTDRCASCKSACTRLVQSQTYGLPPKPVYICTHRELCKQMMIMEHMLRNVRSA